MSQLILYKKIFILMKHTLNCLIIQIVKHLFLKENAKHSWMQVTNFVKGGKKSHSKPKREVTNISKGVSFANLVAFPLVQW